MKYSNNNFLLFLSQKETASRVTEAIRKKYPGERNNLIESASTLSEAVDILKSQYEKGVYFDIIVLDMRIPLNVREEFVRTVTGQQARHHLIMASYNTKLTGGEKKFIEDNKIFLIPDVDELTLLSLLEAIFEKRFNEKKYHLINRIDDIVNLKVASGEILNQIAHNTLDYLNLKTCGISLVNYESGKLEIGALIGFGEFEEEYRKIFDISLSETAVIIESIRTEGQVQYEDVLAENCPFKYKDFAKKIGLKSILVTPIEGKAGDEKGKIVGTLNLYTYFSHKFQDDELELARIIAAKIAVVLSMKRIYEKERDDTGKKLELIEKVAAEINRNVSDYKEVFKTIVDEGIRLVQAHRGCIKVYDKNRGYISREYPDYCVNVPYRSEKLREQDITSYVIKNRESVIIPDIDKCKYKDPKLEYNNYGSRISVPLWSDKDKDVIGVLTAEHDEKNYFNEHHLRLFEALAKHAVIAIENTNRYKELQKRLQCQLIIQKLIKETSKLEGIEGGKKRNKYKVDQLDRIIEDAIQETGKIFKAISGFVVLTDFKNNFAIRNNRWRLGLSKFDLPDLEIGVIEKGEVTFKVRKSITGKVIAEGRLYNCGDVTKDEFYLKYWQNDKTRSEIVIPLKFQNHTFGAFALDSNEEKAFSKDDEEILESIATHMALLIKRFGYLNKLLDLNKPFLKIDDLEQLYEEIVNLTVTSMETKVCYLRILDRNQLVVKGKIGLEGENDTLPLKIGEGIAGIVAQTQTPKLIENVQNISCEYEYKYFAKENNLFAMVSVPIVSVDITSNRDLVGVLNTYANRICNFTSMDLQIMRSIAEKAAEAIKKARLIKQLDSIAKVDEVLTTTSEKGVLKDIVNIAKDLLDADQVVLYQYNSNIKESFGFSTPAITSGNFIHEEFKSQAYFTKDSLLVLLLDKKLDKLFVQSYEEDLIKKIYKKEFNFIGVKPFYQREELKSVIILKLIYKEEMVGILFINYRYQKSFSQEEKQIAKTFANKAAIAISTIRRYEDIDRLHSVGTTIASVSDIEKVLERIALDAQVTLNADNVIFHRYNRYSEKFYTPIYSGIIYEPDAILGEYGEENVKFKLIENGKDIFARDVRKNEIFISGETGKMGIGKETRFAEREKIISCAAMLLKVRREIVGVMFINYRSKQKFDQRQKRIIKIFASQAAIATRNANLIDESRQTVRRIRTNLSAIQQSGNTIVKNLRKTQIKIHDILQPTIDKAMRLINVDMGYIGVIKKDKEKMEIMVCSKRYKKLKDKLVDYIYEDSDWVKTHKRFDIHSKDRKDSDYKTFFKNPQLLADYPDLNFTEDKDIQSALRVPIYSSNKELLAMIILESEKENAFSENDAYTVVSLANQAALALQNYKLINQLKKLREIDSAILREHNDLNKVLKVILTASLELVKKKHADIKLLMENGDLIVKKSSTGTAEGHILSVSKCLSGIAIETKKTHYERDVLKNTRFLKTPGVNTKSELVIPLMVDEKPIGVLNIESEKVEDFTDENITVLKMLSGQAAIAIQLAQQKDKLIEKEKEANIGYVTRESVHWVGNKIGPIKQRVESIQEELNKKHHLHSLNNSSFMNIRKDLDLISEAAESALAIKSDLIDPGQNKKKFDLIQLLNNCIYKIEHENDNLKITLHSKVNAFNYYWDYTHTEKVFYYILKNAVQAIEDKIKNLPVEKKRIYLAMIEVRILKNGNHLLIEFEDNGCGIHRDDMSKLYRPFFTTKGANRGCGVGLYFCKRTMTDIGGKIYVKSTELGVGTNFCLEFPFQRGTT